MIKKVKKTESGVNVRFIGDVEKKKVEEMVESCKSGRCGCSCDPAMFEKIKGMDVDGNDGDVTIALKGVDLGKEEVEDAVKGCNI